MKTTIQFLDAVRARRGLTSDYQLAKFLGTTQQAVSAYRMGKAGLGEEMCLKIADALELAPGYVLAAIAAERAKRTDVRKAWEGVARKLAGAAIGLILGAWLLVGGDHAGLIAMVAAAPIDAAGITHYAHILGVLAALALLAALWTAAGPSGPLRRPQIASGRT